MSNEIATYSMILSKLSLGQSGTECPTKTQILAINSLIVIDNASTYGANECVKIDDIRKKVETWNYYLTVSPTSMSFGAGGGSKSFTVSSYKRKVLDGVEQSGDISVSLKSTTISGTGFSLSGTTVRASANKGTSNRTGTVTITQNESNKTATISLSQSGDTISSYGEWTISVSASPTSVSSSGGTSTITASAKRTVYWASGYVTEETGNPTLSTNLGSLSSTASPSTLTLGENTSTSSRTATIKATHGGKSATCTVTQTGYTPPADNYVFTWEGGSTSDVSTSFPWNFSTNGTAANISVVSTKNGSSQSWSVSSKPSWITTSTTSSKVTISASDNSGSARSGEVVLTQSGSGKTLTVNVSQDAYVADTYVFTITPNTYDASYSNTSFIPRTVSTKNGSNIGYSLTSGGTDWVVVSTTGKITVEILRNTTSSTRSTTLVFTQNESGKTQSIEITQSGYTPTYTFNVTPTNLSVTAAETNETLTVNSYKTVLKSDGSETTESLDYEFSSDTSWVNAARTTTNTTYITIAENLTVAKRNAKITLTQAESGAQAFVNVIQDGKAEVVNKLTLNSRTYDNCYLFLPSTTPVGSNGWDYYMFMADTTLNWYASRGIVVNGGTAYAGDLVNIYVYSSGSYKLVKSFQLQLGEQTVIY